MSLDENYKNIIRESMLFKIKREYVNKFMDRVFELKGKVSGEISKDTPTIDEKIDDVKQPEKLKKTLSLENHLNISN